MFIRWYLGRSNIGEQKMRDIPLWQELIENHYNSSSYTNKLKIKNEKLEKEN